MRLTNEEIEDKYGNYYKGFKYLYDSQAVYYGDIPSFKYRLNNEENTMNPYIKGWECCDVAKKFILSQVGDFDEYNFGFGSLLIATNGKPLFGDLSIKFGNKSSYNNLKIRFYDAYEGQEGFNIFQFNGKYNHMGNYNYGDRAVCYSMYSEDFDKDKLEKIFAYDNKDWGFAPRKIMEHLNEMRGRGLY